MLGLIYLFLAGMRRQPWTADRFAGVALICVGLGLVLTARMQLGDSFSISPKAKALVTRGLYSRIRNPMYVFVDLVLLGMILAARLYSWPALIAFAAILSIQTWQAKRESTLLEDKFGEAYRQYRKQTWF